MVTNSAFPLKATYGETSASDIRTTRVLDWNSSPSITLQFGLSHESESEQLVCRFNT